MPSYECLERSSKKIFAFDVLLSMKKLFRNIFGGFNSEPSRSDTNTGVWVIPVTGFNNVRVRIPYSFLT